MNKDNFLDPPSKFIEDFEGYDIETTKTWFNLDLIVWCEYFNNATEKTIKDVQEAYDNYCRVWEIDIPKEKILKLFADINEEEVSEEVKKLIELQKQNG